MYLSLCVCRLFQDCIYSTLVSARVRAVIDFVVRASISAMRSTLAKDLCGRLSFDPRLEIRAPHSLTSSYDHSFQHTHLPPSALKMYITN